VVIAVLAVIWVVALTPMALRKLSERRLATSVDSFHRQLHSLRRVYPRLAASAADPAVALSLVRIQQGGARRAPVRPSESSQSPEDEWRVEDDPAGVDAFEDAADDISLTAEHLEARGVRQWPSPSTRRPSSRASRRRRVLLILGSAVLGFLLLGAIPSLRILWDASLLVFGVTAAYLALLIHFHRRAAERAMKVVEMPERRREARVGETGLASHYPERRKRREGAARSEGDLLVASFEAEYDESMAGGR